MKKPDNPFVLSGYFGKKYFCDRDEDLSTLKEHLSNERNIVLYAWRRMGKTALVKCLFEELNQTKDHETIYVDLLTTQSLEDSIRRITLAVYEKYGKTSSGFSAALRRLLSVIGVSISFDPITGIPDISFEINQPYVPEKSLMAIGEFLTGRKKEVVITMDEFQQVTDYEENAEATFRNWMQEFPSLRFIYSGSHRGMMEAMFTDNRRPFYKSAQLMSLDPLSLDAYSTFIQDHFSNGGKTISIDIIQQIYEWCRRQTYSIQLVCNYLYGRYSKIRHQDLESIFHSILEQENAVFVNYQKILPSTQWDVLKAVGKEGRVKNPMGQKFVMGHQLGAASSVRTALQALIKKEMVVQEDDGYMIHDIILSRWLARLL